MTRVIPSYGRIQWPYDGIGKLSSIGEPGTGYTMQYCRIKIEMVAGPEFIYHSFSIYSAVTGSSFNSTRRFVERPLGVLLDVTGRFSP